MTLSEEKRQELAKFKEDILYSNLSFLTAVMNQDLEIIRFDTSKDFDTLVLPEGWEVKSLGNKEHVFYNFQYNISIPLRKQPARNRLF